jgi:hypothetical protein
VAAAVANNPSAEIAAVANRFTGANPNNVFVMCCSLYAQVLPARMRGIFAHEWR